MELPKISVDQKVIIGLAILALVVSYTVYLENRKLKKALNQTHPGPKLATHDEVIPVEEGTLKPEDIKPPADLDADLMKE